MPATWPLWLFVMFGNGTQSALPGAKTRRRVTPPELCSSCIAVPATPAKYSIFPVAPELDVQLKKCPVGVVASYLSKVRSVMARFW